MESNNEKHQVKDYVYFCRDCKKTFTVQAEDHYYNWNCPLCNSISPEGSGGSLGYVDNVMEGIFD